MIGFAELMESIGVATCVVSLLWTVCMLTISHVWGPSLGSSIQTSLMPRLDWFSFRHVVAFFVGLSVMAMLLDVGGLSDAEATALVTIPWTLFMWFLISVAIDMSTTAVFGATTNTRSEVQT